MLRLDLMNVKSYLFDFDGTFVDTAPGLIDAANLLFKKYGKDFLPFEQGRAISSDGTYAFLRQRFNESNENFDALARDFLGIYNELILEKLELFPGIRPMLFNLKEKNRLWGIVTNKPRNLTEKILHHLNLIDEVDVLICGDDGYTPKPAPDMINAAMNHLSVLPSETIYIGDGLRDIQSAQACHVYSILVSYGYLKPDDDYRAWGASQIIDDIKQLNII